MKTNMNGLKFKKQQQHTRIKILKLLNFLKCVGCISPSLTIKNLLHLSNSVLTRIQNIVFTSAT